MSFSHWLALFVPRLFSSSPPPSSLSSSHSCPFSSPAIDLGLHDHDHDHHRQWSRLLEEVAEKKDLELEGSGNHHRHHSHGEDLEMTSMEPILHNCGLRTGLFTSLHLIDVRERFRLDGLEIYEEKFLAYFWWCWDRLQIGGNSSESCKGDANGVGDSSVAVAAVDGVVNRGDGANKTGPPLKKQEEALILILRPQQGAYMTIIV
ncbi:hypothetical protein J5N97_023382 [Dioscorea zingiberensis]|uniref:Uncharacterized protein n=1 Tax=Dioscorea zingiberensis TaxID=325984 RepID=A0A9D5CD08_9LILI|nr:hypothetical protein J5N97_023382 [Dioscorea zingiberensis]